MDKSILITQTPYDCECCTFWKYYKSPNKTYGDAICSITDKRVPEQDKPDWCPLIPYNKFVDNIIIDNYHNVGSYAFTDEDKEADFSGLSDN